MHDKSERCVTYQFAVSGYNQDVGDESEALLSSSVMSRGRERERTHQERPNGIGTT